VDKIQDIRRYAVVIGMKIMATTLLTLAILIVGVGFYSHVQHRQRDAIVNVFSARRHALKTSVEIQIVNKKRKAVADRRVFLHRLMEITTDDCPSDFQRTWLDYVQAYRNFVDPSVIANQEQQLLKSPTKASVEAQREIEGDGRLEVGFGSLLKGNAGGEISGKYSSSVAGSIERDKDNLKEAVELLKSADSRPILERLEKIALAHGVNSLNNESSSLTVNN
jgi:hypothetical protein